MNKTVHKTRIVSGNLPMKPSSLSRLNKYVQKQKKMNKDLSIINRMRVTHKESILLGIRELQRQALSVRRTLLKIYIIVRQRIPLNFINGTSQTINIQSFNLALYS